MILTITLIKLRSPWKYIDLTSHYLKITKSASCSSLKSTGFWTTFYTMTLWESSDAMKSFARSGAHLEAMKFSAAMAKEIRTLTIESTSILGWNEAKEKLLRSGKILKY